MAPHGRATDRRQIETVQLSRPGSVSTRVAPDLPQLFNFVHLNLRVHQIRPVGVLPNDKSTLSPDVGGGTLSPGKSTTVTFIIGLHSAGPFQFRVAVRGELGS